MIQTELFTGADLRDIGMQRAIDHANAVHANWAEDAYAFLIVFVASHQSEFLAEDVIGSSVGIVPNPPDTRAWGSVIVRAKKEGIIRSNGFRAVKNKQAHNRPSTVWVKA